MATSKRPSGAKDKEKQYYLLLVSHQICARLIGQICRIGLIGQI